MKTWLFVIFMSAGMALGQTNNPGGGGGGAVNSVNGKTGTVVLVPSDIGAAASPPAVTPGVGGPVVSNPSSAFQSLVKVSQVYGAGDSFMQGTGMSNYDDTFMGLLENDTPYPPYNFAKSGTYSYQYNVGDFIWNPGLPSAILISGLENDAVNDGGGGAPGSLSIRQLGAVLSNIYGTVLIPPTQHQYASQATTNSGTMFAVATNANNPYALPGTPQFSGTAFQKTFTITTPTTVTKIGLTYNVINTNTATATANVDGVNYLDPCTGTTTIQLAPCATLVNGSTQASYRIEATVTPGTSHVITYTAGAASVSTNTIIGVDWIIPATVPNLSGNAVFQFATNPAWTNFANYNTAAQAVTASFRANGLNVFDIDGVNGYTQGGVLYSFGGPTNTPTLGTSSTPTTSCTGTNSANHPNSCGHEWYRELVDAAGNNAGWKFTSPNSFGNIGTAKSMQFASTPMIKESGATIPSASTISLVGNSQFGGVSYISGTTTINVLTPPALCNRASTDCEETLIFVNAGGNVGTSGGVGGFAQSCTTAVANQAIKFTYSWGNTKWQSDCNSANAIKTAIRSGTASNTDLTGTLTIASAATTTSTYTFLQTYTSPPNCWVDVPNITPAVKQALSGIAVQTTTTTLSATLGTAAASALTAVYGCTGRN